MRASEVSCSRRGVLTAPLGLALAHLLPSALKARERHEDYIIHKGLRDPYYLDTDFTMAERELLESALHILYRRLFKFPYDLLEGGFKTAGVSIDADYWQRARDNIASDARLAQRHLVTQQFTRLIGHVFTHGNKFPSIHIDAYLDAEDYAVARASVGVVLLSAGPDGLTAEPGLFRLRINRYYLLATSRPEYRDSAYWAGVIMHEMLHNLGHMHPEGSDPQYHMYQMTCLEYLLRADGQYQYGSRIFPTKCGAYFQS